MMLSQLRLRNPNVVETKLSTHSPRIMEERNTIYQEWLVKRLPKPILLMSRSLLIKIRSLPVLWKFLLLLLLLLLLLPNLQIYRIYLEESQTSPFLVSSKSLETRQGRGISPPSSIFRFPSPEERVRYYMSDWYSIKNSTHTDTTISTDVCSQINYWRIGMKEKGEPYLFDANNLQTLQYKDWPFRLPWRFQRGHPADAYRYHFVLANTSTTASRMLTHHA